MAATLSPLDFVLVILYVLGTTFLGVWFSRQRDIKSYFVGDRNVSWWLVLISIVATETSTVTFLSVPGLAFRPGGNLTFLQLSFGYLIGRTLIALLLLPQFLRGELFSAYQVLRERFNPAVQRTASGLFLLTRAIADGLRLYLSALLLQQFTGWSIQLSVLALGLVTMLYTYLGGMQAVIWTDLIQFVIYIAGALLAALFMLRQLPGGWDEFVRVGTEHGKFQVIDLSTDLTLPYTLLAGLLGGAFVTMASHGADQMMVQRYLCSRSLGEARLALVLSGFVVLAQFLLFLLIGVGLFTLYDRGVLAVPEGTPNDAVFGLFIVHRLPHGLVGLVIASVLAAAMSTLSSSLNSSASATVADFYRPLYPGREERHYLLVSRVLTCGWGMARIAVALVALEMQGPHSRSIIDQVLSVAGFTTGMVLGLFLLGSLRHRVRSGAALGGLVVGFGAVLVVWLPVALEEPMRRLGESGGPFAGLLTAWSGARLAWPWYAPLGTGVTVLVALALDAFGTRHGSPADGRPQPGLDQPG
jgi:solute:Na+ symporter, SSS family